MRPRKWGSSIVGVIRRLLGRRGIGPRNATLRFADLELCTTTHSVRRGGSPIELTPTEFDLLEMFLRNPGRVVSRAAIATRVWGFENLATTSNSLNVYIGYLRRKTEAGGRPRLIHTVRGVGYILREPQTEANS
jgi:two-component system, OmpR family, response regulator MprA